MLPNGNRSPFTASRAEGVMHKFRTPAALVQNWVIGGCNERGRPESTDSVL